MHCSRPPSSTRASRPSSMQATGSSRTSGWSRRSARRGPGSRSARKPRRSTQGSRRRTCSRALPGATRSSRSSSSSGARARHISREPPPASASEQTRRRRSRPSSPKRASRRSRSRTPSSPASSRSEGRLVRVGDGLAIGTKAYEEAKRALVEECERAGKITLARFRDLLGISRRPAQLLLERFDADGITRRIGDERVLRRGATIDP